MKFNKMLAKTLVFAMAISFAPSFGTTAKAAAPAVTFDPATQEVKFGSDFYWGTVKKLKKEKGSNFKDSTGFYKIENVEKAVGKVLNISNLKFGKDMSLAFGSAAEVSNAEWKVLKFPAEEKTLKVYYGSSKNFGKFTGNTHTFGNNDAGFIGASTGKKELKEVETTKLEVHNGNGIWKSYADFFGAADNDKVGAKLKGFIQTGATLHFRLKGDGASFTVNSKEVKVKIPAQAAAPKIIIKGDKSGLKKGLEYIAVETTKPMTAWVEVADAKEKQYVDQVFTDKTKTHDFYVRTATKGKKGPSKYVKLIVSRATKPEIITGSATVENIVTDKGTDNLIKDAKAESKVGLKTKLAYDIKKGVELTNSSDKNYECYLSFTGAEPPVGAKWFNLKAAKDSTKPTKVTLKYSAADKPNTYAGNQSSKLYIRRPAEKQVGNKVVLASDALGFKFNVKDVEQTAKFTNAGTNVVIATDKDTKATLHSVKAGEATSYSLKITATELVKTGAKPKIKMEKLDGVKVTVGAFEEGMTADVNVEISAKAFGAESDIAGKKVTFTLNYEGIKDKEFEINLSKDAPSGP